MPKVTWMSGDALKVEGAKERRGPRSGHETKRVKVRGGLGKGGKPFNYGKKRAVRDTASSRDKCRTCGEPLKFDIDKFTTKLVRLNLDGTLHEHQDG